MSDGGDRYEIEDSNEFPSVDISLEEARRRFDVEQARKSNIEVKIGVIVGIDSFLLAFIGIFGGMSTVTKLIVLFPTLVAVLMALQAFNSREYRKPGPKIDDIFSYAHQDRANAEKNLIQNYRQAVSHNTRKNSERMATLNNCLYLTGFSFLLLLVAGWIDGMVHALYHLLNLL